MHYNFRKNSSDKRTQENNNRIQSTQNNEIKSSTKQKETSKVTSRPSSSGWQKSDSVINKIKGVESRRFPGEKIPQNSYNKTKRPRSRSRSRSPVPNKYQKSTGMRIESDRYVHA